MLAITELDFASLEEVDHIANLRPDAFKNGGVEGFVFDFFLRLAALTNSCLIRHWWCSRYFFGWLSIPSFTATVHHSFECDVESMCDASDVRFNRFIASWRRSFPRLVSRKQFNSLCCGITPDRSFDAPHTGVGTFRSISVDEVIGIPYSHC
eukprot:s4934_g2.t1